MSNDSKRHRRFHLLSALVLTASLLTFAGTMIHAGSSVPAASSKVLPKNSRELGKALREIELEAERKVLDLTARYVGSQPKDKTLDQTYMRLLWSARNLKDHAAFIEHSGKFIEVFGPTHPYAEYVRSMRVSALVDTLDLAQASAGLEEAIQAKISVGTGVENAFVKCANLYALQGKFDEARAVIDRISELPDSTKVVESAQRWKSMLERPFPHFEGKSIDGKLLRTADLSKNKKLTVICFWATWCPTCVEDQEALGEWLRKYGSDRIQLIGVNLDSTKGVKNAAAKEDRSPLKAFIAEMNMTWPQIVEDAGWKSPSIKALGVVGLPSMFVIDEQGRTIAVDMSADMLEILASHHLESKAQGK